MAAGVCTAGKTVLLFKNSTQLFVQMSTNSSQNKEQTACYIGAKFSADPRSRFKVIIKALLKTSKMKQNISELSK